MADHKVLTETGLDNFKFFIKFLANNDLLDEAYDRLKAKGMEKLVISLDAVHEIQAMIKEKSEASGDTSKSAAAVIASAHNNNF